MIAEVPTCLRFRVVCNRHTIPDWTSPDCTSLAHTADGMKRSLAVALLLTCACIGLALASLLTSGCTSVLDIQNPTYSIRDIRPHISIAIPLSASSIDFNFNLGVDNPNRISLPVAHLDFDLFANDTHLIS